MDNEGKVITFYSYKGGVGRSMALANIACLLAKWGKKVLIVDFDLEAPGIEKYFENKELEVLDFSDKGVINLIYDKIYGDNFNWQENLTRINSLQFPSPICILSSGRGSKNYIKKLQKLNWEDLFEKYDFGNYLENVRKQWIAKFDYVLIDSRTGITDIGGITTIHLPDVIVFMFTTNNESLDGCVNTINKIKTERQKLPFDRNSLITIPLPSRDESRTEFKLAQLWKEIFVKKLESFYNDWLPKDSSAKSVIDVLRIPYIPYWSFGERIPVLEEGTADHNGIGYSYEKVAQLIYNDFDWKKTNNIEKKENTKEKKEEKSVDYFMLQQKEKLIIQKLDEQINWYKRKIKNNLISFTIIVLIVVCLLAGSLFLTQLTIFNDNKINVIFNFVIQSMVAISGAILIQRFLRINYSFSDHELPNNRKILSFLENQKILFQKREYPYNDDNYNEIIKERINNFMRNQYWNERDILEKNYSKNKRNLEKKLFFLERNDNFDMWK